MRFSIGVALVLVVALTGLGQGGHEGVGVLFDLGLGARWVGLGGAGIALADDESAPLLNPAGLGWQEGFGVASAFADQFGAFDIFALGVAGPGVGLTALYLDSGPIHEGLTYRTLGGVAAVGWAPGPLSLGLRGRFLRPLSPVPALGWAADVALLWQGPISLGLVGEALLSQAAFPGEDWPRRFSLGIGVPLPLPSPLSGQGAFDLLGLGEGTRTWRLGAEVWVGEGLGIRAGLAGESVSLGFSVRLSMFQLDWGIVAHAVLPAAMRISLALRFGDWR
jgi:hypothetical protein